MKKFLVLVLVLAFASLANATYMISLNLAGDTITVSSDTALIGGLDMALSVAGNATVSDFAFRTENAPVAPPVVTFYSADDLLGAGPPFDTTGWFSWTTFQFGDPSLTPNAAGTWFTATVVGTPGTVIALTDNAGTPIGGSVTLVPEPATIALLCLGGLLLRKKK